MLIKASRPNKTKQWCVVAGALIVSLFLGVPPAVEYAESRGGMATAVQIDPASVPKRTKISAIAGSSARATDPSNNQAIQFAIPGNAANRPFVGQTVLLRTGRAPGGSPTAVKPVNIAVFVGWPAEAHKKDDVSVGHMETWVKLSPGIPNPATGRIDGTTRTWTNNNLHGFTGGVKVQLQDNNGNVLQWDMPVQKYGVNANNPVTQAGSPSERKVDWHFTVPGAVLANVARIRIIHRHTPEGRWDQSIEMAKELGEVLKTYAEVYSTVAGAGGGAPGGTGPTSGPTQPTGR